MSTSEISSTYEVLGVLGKPKDINAGLKELENYITGRVDEIGRRLSRGSRSIFDFVDMAVLISTLANMTDTSSKPDTDQYIDFVKCELLPSTESQKDLIATSCYCLMRCGLIHEMSLEGHKIKGSRQKVIAGHSLSITHDKSKDNHWYSIETKSKEIVFYANELLAALRKCVGKCFDGKSCLWNAVQGKIASPNGMRIIKVK